MENGLQSTGVQPAEQGNDAGTAVDLSGKVMGDFRLVRRLGQGGMGQVYLAEQLSLKRKVALKIMRPEVAANPVSLKRFQQEAEAVARVTHANIVQVYSIGVADCLHYMALEYVEGRNLRDFIALKGPPELLQALSILRQVAAALERAHEAGIIHRDIKPENILLTRKGEVKVADFGLSRCFGGEQPALNITQSGVSMGTPLYMSPEQVESKEIDPRTDLYSLGVTTYHMLTGQPPFRGQSAFEVAIQHVQSKPQPLQELRPDLPSELCGIVHKLMAKAPTERYQTSREVVADVVRLRQTLSGLGGMATQGLAMSQPLPPEQLSMLLAAANGATKPRRLGRKLGRVVLAVLALSLAMAFGGGLRFWQGIAAPTVPPSTRPAPTAALRLTSQVPHREAELQALIKMGYNPGAFEEFRKHFDATMHLGLLYVDQRRLSEADTFFKQLRDKPPQDGKIYSGLGKIGQGLV
ncbi:MAG: serine/threonine protein kinase, partial [Planctomycetia bacterium]|nr:serine/threonine protein kinase [Planctomycetia bacterium]